MQKKIYAHYLRGRSQTTLTIFWYFFDHLPTPVCYYKDKSAYLSIVDISSTTYLPHLDNVVKERPPKYEKLDIDPRKFCTDIRKGDFFSSKKTPQISFLYNLNSFWWYPLSSHSIAKMIENLTPFLLILTYFL